jgi:hypothetical protein
MKDFHNVFAYYGKSKAKEVKCQRNYIFFSYDVMLEYIFVSKKYMSHRTKKCKYIQERIEMIFSLYEICNIYQTF